MSKKFDVIIIVACAAGLMYAIKAGKRNKKVLIVEHTFKIAKKIRISKGVTSIFVNLLFQNTRKIIL